MTNPVEIVEIVPQSLVAGARWSPTTGSEVDALFRQLNLPGDGRATVLTEALAILSRCTPPTDSSGGDTGLVIGYVQSGKTISFTTVTALARDNNYRIVIVLTGTSDPLLNQSISRLTKDLRLNDRRDRTWQHFSNPSQRDNSQRAMSDLLAEWEDPSVPATERQTILVTVMKNHRHLDNLAAVLEGLELQGVPTLIVDDEADQAGLNTQVRQGQESTTYRRLLRLRRVLPHHAFLQYTATPQAPLLINLIDVLSPDFVQVLTPGAGYVGGVDFFSRTPGLVRTIVPTEIPTRRQPLVGPPTSLLEAMRVFFLGVAAGWVLEAGQGNRSMLVHPSSERAAHRQYFQWVEQIKEEWRRILELAPSELDRIQLLEDFESAYADLRATVTDLPSFEQLIDRLLHAIRRTRVEEVNSARGRTPNIDWRAVYAYILVGGQAMDRGFTVEGLTVTYMPRGIGVGNADTVQQRARFFGYKREILGYCRVYLENTARDAFRLYVTHEEDVRQQMLGLQETGRTLAEWKRSFFLTSLLRPTRNNVLDLDYMRGNFSNQWYRTQAPHYSDDAIEANRTIVDGLVSSLRLGLDPGNPGRTTAQKHLLDTRVPLNVVQQFLTQFRMAYPDDSQRMTGLLLQVEKYIEQQSAADEECSVFLMSRGDDPNYIRDRGLDELTGEIINLFQGEAPVEPRNQRGSIYPGDERIRAQQGMTVQIHYLCLRLRGSEEIIADNVPAVAVWLPREMGEDWLVQNQGGIA